MPQPLSIPPLIPLPPGSDQSTTHDPKDDIFATLFSPATPRASPTLQPVPDEAMSEPVRPNLRHSRTSSVDSDFGSFVSVPSTEDPLHQQASDIAQISFSPLHNFEFFDRFTEEAKAATEKNKKVVLNELLHHQDDPLYFLRSGTRHFVCNCEMANTWGDEETPTATQQARGTEELSTLPTTSRPGSSLGEVSASKATSTLIDDLPAQPLISLDEPSTSLLLDAELTHVPPSHPSPLTPATTLVASSSQNALPEPQSGLLHELLEHEDDPMYFHASRSASTSRTPTPQPASSGDESNSTRAARHPSRESNWTEPREMRSPGSLVRSPSLPPSPTRISNPEVQKTQSFFMPTSFTTSSFPTKWVSSLLSRPAFSVHPPPPAPQTHPVIDGLPSHGRAATIPGAMPITHGTPFAAHTYIPPSGAPGFAGDRAWNKGFEFDKENVERASVNLVGRKQGTNGILTVSLADKVNCFHGVALLKSSHTRAAAAASSGFKETSTIMDVAIQSRPTWHLTEYPVHSV